MHPSIPVVERNDDLSSGNTQDWSKPVIYKFEAVLCEFGKNIHAVDQLLVLMDSHRPLCGNDWSYLEN